MFKLSDMLKCQTPLFTEPEFPLLDTVGNGLRCRLVCDTISPYDRSGQQAVVVRNVRIEADGTHGGENHPKSGVDTRRLIPSDKRTPCGHDHAIVVPEQICNMQLDGIHTPKVRDFFYLSNLKSNFN